MEYVLRTPYTVLLKYGDENLAPRCLFSVDVIVVVMADRLFNKSV